MESRPCVVSRLFEYVYALWNSRPWDSLFWTLTWRPSYQDREVVWIALSSRRLQLARPLGNRKVEPVDVMTVQTCPDGKSRFADGQAAGVPPDPWVFAQLGFPLTIAVGMHGLTSPCPQRCKPRVPTYDTDRPTLPGNC